MPASDNNAHRNESIQVVSSTLFTLLFLVVAGAVFATTSFSSQADTVQKVMVSLVLALFPILIIGGSILRLFGKPADEIRFDTN